jgi:hypothetical protein
MPAIAARASSPPMTVPMAPDQSTTMPVVRSQKPISFAAGSGKNARTAIRLENANGQISRAYFVSRWRRRPR